MIMLTLQTHNKGWPPCKQTTTKEPCNSMDHPHTGGPGISVDRQQGLTA